MRLHQIKGKIWLGRAKTVTTRTSSYFGYINFIMIILTFYSVTGYKYAPLWVFLTAAITSLLLIAAVDFFILLPSEVSFANQQIARHQSPIYDMVKDIRDSQVGGE